MEISAASSAAKERDGAWICPETGLGAGRLGEKTLKKSFSKLKRVELVELIYQLRKDNLELRKRLKESEQSAGQAEEMLGQIQESLDRVEKLYANRITQLEAECKELRARQKDVPAGRQ